MKSVLCVFPVLVTNNDWQEKHMQRTKLGLSVYSPNHECKCKRSPSCFSPAFPLSLLSPVISSSLFVIHPPAVHKNFLAIQKYSNIIPAVNKKKNRAIKRFYTLVLSVLRVRQRKRVYACLCHECGMASSSGPASNWGPSQFCETPGGREERDKDREPCHQNLSSSGSLLINLQSWGSLAETH